MSDPKKNDSDIKPLDIHATGADADKPKLKDIHATSEPVTNGDIHATSEPAN
ncbi:hypothetical protein GCM10010329_48970 [Streptomyces spiroverticillatus]|uniref:Sigma-like protein n=1 Tax=Streptomyces finlayi TaxID=67296 RepID=A0A918X1F1_9ACTN|nr:hypothetical protein [Streptomyces finlayi]GHA20032.1 hypothetical protein GCM10010329_48970 [Streptomyces spiroverticillatus]GHD02862.1 hypothetical protein GCM10010334_49920 [Streptomyces finlayi]